MTFLTRDTAETMWLVEYRTLSETCNVHGSWVVPVGSSRGGMAEVL
jgi:hypothetical protein